MRKGELEIRPGKDAPRQDPLAAHAAECTECQGGSLPLAEIRSVLEAAAVDLDAALMSQRALAGLRPELQRLATHAYWRRVAATLLRALVPLPLVATYNLLLLRVWYLAIHALLPAAMATYLVLSYSAFLILLFALTYAAIPLLLARSPTPYVPART